jgi:hypothetical protein
MPPLTETALFLREVATPLNIGAMFCRGVLIVFEAGVWRPGVALWVEPFPVTETEDKTVLPVGAVSLADACSNGLAKGVSSVAGTADGGVAAAVVGIGLVCVFSARMVDGELVLRVDERADVCS